MHSNKFYQLSVLSKQGGATKVTREREPFPGDMESRETCNIEYILFKKETGNWLYAFVCWTLTRITWGILNTAMSGPHLRDDTLTGLWNLSRELWCAPSNQCSPVSLEPASWGASTLVMGVLLLLLGRIRARRELELSYLPAERLGWAEPIPVPSCSVGQLFLPPLDF